MQVIANVLKGVAIGLANIIPGVSGGTMALLLGIYERLIRAIHHIGLKTLAAPFRGRAALREQLRRVDALFLMSLGVGAAVAAVGVAELLLYLLERQHDPTYGFFFGLVLVSALVPLRLIKRPTLGVMGATVAGVVAVLGLTLAMSGEQRVETARRKAHMAAEKRAAEKLETDKPEVGQAPSGVAARSSPPITPDAGMTAFFVLAGAVAISAMILPGISGSFMLLLMGIYFDVLACITRTVALTKQLVSTVMGSGVTAGGATGGELMRELVVQLIPLAALGVGCVVGLLLFSRMINYLLETHHDLTMGFLLGLVLGSLYAIWPFKTHQMVAGSRIDLHNIWPSGFGFNELLTVGTTLLGAAIVAGFLLLEWRMGRRATVAR
jgi:putative membrane protein